MKSTIINVIIRILKEFWFESLILITIFTFLLLQGSEIIDALFIISVLFVFLVVFYKIRKDVLEISETMVISLKSFEQKHFTFRMILLLVYGITSTVLSIFLEAFSIFVIFSNSKPEYFGLPFGFYSYETGEILATPFFINSIIISLAIYLSSKIKDSIN